MARSLGPRALAGIIGVSLASLGGVLAACSSTSSGTAAERVDGGALSCASEGLTYESFGGPFFLDWCTGCHSAHLEAGERQGAPVGIDFDTLDGILAQREQILVRVGAGTMPPVGGPSEEDRARLEQWLACDAPVAVAAFSPPLPPESLMGAEPGALGACAGPRDTLPAEVLPRCTAETGACIATCVAGSADDSEEEACRDACTAADPTPAVIHEGLPIDCSNCGFFQMMGCGSQNGCEVEVGELMCCIDDCIATGDGTCFERECSGKIQGFAYCVGFGAPECVNYTGGVIGECYAAP